MSIANGPASSPTFAVMFYRTENGHVPVEDFIRSLEPKMRAKTIRTIELLRQYGPRLGEPYSKHLANGIFELRIQQSNNITRILYFFIRGRKVILIHGFIKKEPRTPRSELERASSCKVDFERRQPDG